MIDPELLAVLACPRCDDRPPLEDAGDRLVCTVCRWAYRIENGIPNLLAEEAEPPSDAISDTLSDASTDHGDNFERT